MNENYENNFVEETVADEVYEVADYNEVTVESGDDESGNLAGTIGKVVLFGAGALVGVAATKVAKPAKEFVCEKAAEIKEAAAEKKAEKAAKKEAKKAKKEAKKTAKAEKKETVIEGTAKEVTDKK